MSVTLLGHPRYLAAEGEVGLQLTKPAALLIYLACRADWVSRDELALFLRPEADDKTARNALRLTLNRARKLPWSEGLEQDQNRLRFTPESDLADFKLALGKGDWAAATHLYDGDFLTGADLALPSFMAWLDVERAALATAWQEAALKHAERLSEDARYSDSAQVLARVLAADSLAEDILQRYLRSAYLAGEAAAALAAFERFRIQLEDELSLEPLAETAKLAQTIRAAKELSPLESQKSVNVPLAILRPPQTVGRSVEKKQLAANTGLSVIKGEAGVGKSRLAADLAPNALTLQGRDGLNHVPYFPILEFIKTLPELPDLGAYTEDVRRLLPGAAVAPPQDGATAKARLLEALARLLESQADCIIFDDLQWADAATLELFVFMAHRAATPLYATLRSFEVSAELAEILSSLRGLLNYRELELTPLDQRAVAELLSSLFPQDSEAPEFSTWLTKTSGGNPFFLLETLRALFEAKILSETEAGWYSSLDSVTRSYAELALPPGVAALVERRVRGLSSQSKRLLDIAAVLADALTPELAARLGALSVWAAADALSELESRGLLKNAHFAHDLTRQALYEALPDAKRRFIHEQIANVLINADELIRAEHYYLADAPARAAGLWFNVARFRFSEGNFVAEALALYERIVSLDIATADFYRAQAYLAGRYRTHNRLEETNTLIDSVLTNSSDPLARTYALLQKTTLHFFEGDMDAAQQTQAAAERQVSDFDDAGLQRDVALNRVYLDQHAGKTTQALALAQKILSEARLEPPDFGLISWLSVAAYVHCTLGEFEAALALYYEQLDVARSLGFKRQQAQAASDIMATLYDMGRIQEGLSLGEEALELGDFDVMFPLRYHLALAYFEQQRFEDVLVQSRVILSGDSTLNIKSHTYALLAEVHALRSEAAETAQVLNAGLELVKDTSHNDAKAMMSVAALRFGTSEHVEQAKPLLKDLMDVTLPAYIHKDFEAALALGRHEG